VKLKLVIFMGAGSGRMRLPRCGGESRVAELAHVLAALPVVDGGCANSVVAADVPEVGQARAGRETDRTASARGVLRWRGDKEV